MSRLEVLAPLDRSAFSRAAQALALRIAPALHARLTALRVVPVRAPSGSLVGDLPGLVGFEPAVVDAEEAEAALAEAHALVADYVARAEAGGCEVRGVVEQGAVGERLAHHAAAADLVVMGLFGETEERFPRQGGGHTGSVLHHVATPILWATPGADRIDAVALGYDGSESSLRAVRSVRHLLAPLGVPIHAVFVTPDGHGGEVLDGLEIEGAELVRHVVRADRPHEALIEATERVDAQVLVLGFRGRRQLQDVVYGTLTERIVLSGRVAVLAVH